MINLQKCHNDWLTLELFGSDWLNWDVGKPQYFTFWEPDLAGKEIQKVK